MHVLDAGLAGLGDLDDRDVVGDVPGEGQVQPVRLVGEGPVDVPAQPGVDLDEVGALRLGVADRLARLGLGAHRDERHPGHAPLTPQRGPAVDHLAGDHQPGPEQAALGDPAAPLVVVGLPGHLTHRGDPVDQVERQVDAFDGIGVQVHVGQPGDEELPGQVDLGGVVGHPDLAGPANGVDAPVPDDDGHVRPRRRAGRVDHGDVGEGERC